MSNLRDELRRYLPSWLNEGDPDNPGFGFRILWSIAACVDATVQAVFQAKLAAVGRGTPTALPYLGDARGVVRGRRDSDAGYYAKLREWIDRNKRRGSMLAIATELHEYFDGARVRVVNRAGHWLTVETDGSVLEHDAPWDWDSVSHPERAGYWSEEWVIVYFAPWGVEGSFIGADAGVWGEVNETVQADLHPALTPSSVSFGFTIPDGDISELGQSFTGNGRKLRASKWLLGKVGSPTGTAVAKVYTHDGTFGTSSVAGELLATSYPIDVAAIPDDQPLDDEPYVLTEFTFPFDQRPLLEAGTKYVCTVEYSDGTDPTDVLSVAVVQAGHPGNMSYRDDATWVADADDDFYFEVHTEAAPTAWGIGHDVGREEHDLVRRILADSKSGHSRIRAVIFTTDANAFNPAGGSSLDPDGTWGAWSVTVGGVQVPSGRDLDVCRYWEDL